jgi:membrane protease subunit HflC
MQTSAYLKWLSILLVLVLLWSATFTVTEGEAALKLWLGKLEQDPKTHHAKIIGPGLHVKVPMFHQIRFFDMRLRTLDVQSSRIVTSEKKDVLVDYYVKWQIDDLGTYFIRTSGEAKRAEMLLSQQLNDALRAEFGRHTIADVVAEDRTDIMSRLSEVANKNAQPLGIKIIDVRIKRIDLPDEVSNAVFETMKAERKRVADEHRARGQSSAEAIRADADATVTVMLATAQKEAEQIRGSGDAQAAHTYAQAFQKDPDFYSFNQSLITYAKALGNSKTVFVMKPDGQFFQYLKKSK